jgi:hypothetical protein
VNDPSATVISNHVAACTCADVRHCAAAWVPPGGQADPTAGRRVAQDRVVYSIRVIRITLTF